MPDSSVLMNRSNSDYRFPISLRNPSSSIPSEVSGFFNYGRDLLKANHAGRLRPTTYIPARKFRDVTAPDSPLHGISPTDLATYSKVFRLKNYLNGRARSLARYLEREVICGNPQLDFLLQEFRSSGGLDVADFFQKTINSLDHYSVGISVYRNFLGEISSLRSLASQLDINSVVLHTHYKDVYEKAKLFPRRFDDHCIKLCGSYEKGPKRDLENDLSFEALAFKAMAERSKFGRKAELLARLTMECRDRSGWFYVFNTLTVKPGKESEVFECGSKAWSNYIVRCDRLFGTASFGSVRKALKERARGNEFHTYFAVVERGSLHGRLHIHVLHIFKTLPDTFSDPNKGLVTPTNRQISAMSGIWEYGFSKPIAVRFCQEDAYGRNGWIWPVKLVKGVKQPLPVRSPVAIVRYIGKYLNKSYTSERDTWQMNGKKCATWRTRLSRSMGKTLPQQMVNQMTKMQCREVLSRQALPWIPFLKIPRMLLRRMVIRRYLPAVIRLATGAIMRILQASAFLRPPVERLKDMILNFGRRNRPNSGLTTQRDLLRMAAFNRLEDQFRAFFKPDGYALAGISGPHFGV